MNPHVKWMARPERLSHVVPAVERAFHEAVSGVPGPVFVELAVDLLYDQKIAREWASKLLDKPNKTFTEQAIAFYVRGHMRYTCARSRDPRFHGPRPVDVVRPSEREIGRALALLAGAERPLLVLGSQTLLHPARVRELVEGYARPTAERAWVR